MTLRFVIEVLDKEHDNLPVGAIPPISSPESISIPISSVLPFKTISHSSFVVSYCQAVFKANGNDNFTMISAAAYAETQSIYFNQGFSGRTWSVHQGELVSNGSIIITGAYMMK